jgi:lysophospholipase L1-like esterase
VAASTTTAFHASGNRVLLLGDSILASTSKRYSNDTCKALVPLGWTVEVEAEVSRGIDFGNTVLASRKKAGWDVGVVFLGTNNGGTDGNVYLRELNKIITSFAPSRVVLVTVSEFRPEMKGINDTIRSIAQVYPEQVSVIDWNQITQASPGILHEDGIHPTVEGRQVLANAIATHLGAAPVPATEGKCLDSLFHDDSAGSVDGKGGAGGTATTVKPRTTQTTAPGATPTTVKGGGSGPTTTVKQGSSTTIGGGSGTTTPSASTVPQNTYGTVAPQTLPPQTAPPATQPPATQPPAPPTTTV